MRTPHYKLSNSKGFTLVELLGVVAIIAILAGIAITGINGAISGSREAAQKRQVQTLNSAYSQFTAAGGSVQPWFNAGPAYGRAVQLYGAMVGAGTLGAGKPDLGMPEIMPQNLQGASQLTVLILDPAFWENGCSMPDKGGTTQYLSWYPTSGFHFESWDSANASSDAQPVIVDGQYKGHSTPTDPFR